MKVIKVPFQEMIDCINHFEKDIMQKIRVDQPEYYTKLCEITKKTVLDGESKDFYYGVYCATSYFLYKVVDLIDTFGNFPVDSFSVIAMAIASKAGNKAMIEGLTVNDDI